MGGEWRVALGCDTENRDGFGIFGGPSAGGGAAGFEVDFGGEGNGGVEWEGEEDAELGW